MSAPPRPSALDRTTPSSVLRPPYRRLTIGILATVLFLAFEGMAVATVMPVAVKDLGGLAWYAWGFSAFLITSLVGMVVAGDLCDRRGPRLPFVVSGAVFAAGLLLAGLANTMALFVLGRSVQGFGMGLAIVALYVVVGRSYPESLRPRAFSVMSSAWVLPSIVGPAVAGWLAENVSWRWAFLGVVPIIIPAMLLVLPALDDHATEAEADSPVRRRRTGLATVAAVGVALLQYAGQHLVAWSLLVLAAAGLLLWRALPRLLPPGTLRAARGLPTSVLMRGLLAAAYFGTEAFIPLMLVRERGLSPSRAGLALTGAALGWAAGSWYQGRPATRLPRHTLVRLGCCLVAVAIVAAALTAVTSVTPWLAAAGCVVGGGGMGLAMASVGVLVLEQSSVADQGGNSASLQMSDALLSTMAIGLGGVLFAALHSSAGHDGTTFLIIDATMLLIAALAIMIAPRVQPGGGRAVAATGAPSAG